MSHREEKLLKTPIIWEDMKKIVFPKFITDTCFHSYDLTPYLWFSGQQHVVFVWNSAPSRVTQDVRFFIIHSLLFPLIITATWKSN